MEEKLPQLVMIMQDLHALPPCQLPDGYDARSLRAGEEGHWEAIVKEAFQYGGFRFAERLAAYDIYAPDRVRFVCDSNDKPVATATAWYDPHWDGKTGYLHMVGVMEAHQGHGLGAAVSLDALRRILADGRNQAVLRTDDFRLPAIRTYIKLGFKPLVEHESHVNRWSVILDQLENMPKLKNQKN